MPQSAIEVELKFRAPTGAADADTLRQRLRELGGRPEATITQADTYFAHPTRNFAATDEALRVRIVGHRGCVTYKGPLLDTATKSREETELWFEGGADAARRFAALLTRLDFRPVRTVTKTRTAWNLNWQDHAVEFVFDTVDGLGDFVELETAADSDSFEAAKQSLLALAERLNLRQSERRSYLALLLGEASKSP